MAFFLFIENRYEQLFIWIVNLKVILLLVLLNNVMAIYVKPVSCYIIVI